MKTIRRLWARFLAWQERYDEWFDSLPAEAKAEVVRRQSQHL
jgi:P2-related tail formation protein